MTEPITPWAEHHRNEWADLTDPFRAPATDEEPWATEPLVDVLGASEPRDRRLGAAAVAMVSAALVLVLTALGLGNLRE